MVQIAFLNVPTFQNHYCAQLLSLNVLHTSALNPSTTLLYYSSCMNPANSFESLVCLVSPLRILNVPHTTTQNHQ